MKRTQTFSPVALEATRLLGLRVREARRARHWTMEALAERVGVSQVTLRNIETGEPTVGIGVVFEAATIVGVALFHESSQRRSFEVDRVNDRLALLPKKVHTPSDLDDDF